MNVNRILPLIIILYLVGCSPVIQSDLTESAEIHKPLSIKTPFIATTPSLLGESAPDPCGQAAMTQGELNDCARQGVEVASARLETLINELQGHMSESQYSALLILQKDWETFALKHCQWEGSYFEGGSIQPMWVSNCLSLQYLGRVETLRINLCEGHGMAGECEESLKYLK